VVRVNDENENGREKMNKVHGPLGLMHPSRSYVGTEVAEGDFSLAQAGS
jgi:hypothetical protein